MTDAFKKHTRTLRWRIQRKKGKKKISLFRLLRVYFIKRGNRRKTKNYPLVLKKLIGYGIRYIRCAATGGGGEVKIEIFFLNLGSTWGGNLGVEQSFKVK